MYALQEDPEIKEVDAIALELVKGMPTWSPGKEKGKPVHCSYTVPITFKS